VNDEKNKIKIIIGLGILIIIVLIVTIFINKKNNNTVFKKSIEEIGRKFYIQYLYEKQKDVIISAMEKNNNITFNFNSISIFIDDDDLKELKDSKFSKCNWQKTVITFKPKQPLESSNFDIDVKLVC